jgi:hypothetical protein
VHRKNTAFREVGCNSTAVREAVGDKIEIIVDCGFATVDSIDDSVIWK